MLYKIIEKKYLEWSIAHSKHWNILSMIQNLLLYESHLAEWGLLCTNTIVSHFLGFN